MKKALFCGGPVDGQWREVDEKILSSRGGPGRIEVVAPPTPRDLFNGTGTITKTQYRLWPIVLLGYHMLVATPSTDHNEDDSVLYAVLQRDVANHLRGKS